MKFHPAYSSSVTLIRSRAFLMDDTSSTSSDASILSECALSLLLTKCSNLWLRELAILTSRTNVVLILIIFNNGTKICPCIPKISPQNGKFMSIMMHDIESHVPVYFLIKKNLLFRKIQKWIFWKKNRKKWKFFIFTGWDRIWLKNALTKKRWN